MASFSKLVAASSSTGERNVSTKHKRILGSKLNDKNNANKDAVKRRKLQIQTATEATQKKTKKPVHQIDKHLLKSSKRRSPLVAMLEFLKIQIL